MTPTPVGSSSREGDEREALIALLIDAPFSKATPGVTRGVAGLHLSLDAAQKELDELRWNEAPWKREVVTDAAARQRRGA